MPWDDQIVSAEGGIGAVSTSGRTIDYTTGIKEALDLALAADQRVILLGQGVEDPNGMFGTTTGLQDKYSSIRVFDIPLSEEGVTGVCVGAAMRGMRPILMHNRPDFILLTMNQIVNHAAVYHYIDNGMTSVPLVIWSAIGRGWGSGAQHSHAIHGMFMGIPGLKVVLPSTPADAKGLMLAAIADNNPVLIFEHRWLMKTKGEVPMGYYQVPIGKGVYRNRGGKITIVGVSHSLKLALEVVMEERLDADVIDLRCIKPLDTEIILESVGRTGRLLVVDSAWEIGGLCAEVCALVCTQGFSSLKAPPKRIGFPDIPTPAGATLEQAFYPNKEIIFRAIREVIYAE